PKRTEGIASRVMGAVKAVKASFKGLHGVFKRLTEEHGEVTALLLRVKSSSDLDVRRELFPKIRVELISHEKGELKDVYPMFENHPELAKMAEEHGAEANPLERKIEELNAMPFEDEAWMSKFKELVDLVQRHVDEEEGEFFPAGERVLGREAAEQME